MSGWLNTKGFTKLATNALMTAQKRIDKVLDIREEGDHSTSSSQSSTTRTSSRSPKRESSSNLQSGNAFMVKYFVSTLSINVTRLNAVYPETLNAFSLRWISHYLLSLI